MTATVARLQGTAIVTLGGPIAASVEFTVPVDAKLGAALADGSAVQVELTADVRSSIAEALRALADQVSPYLATGGAA